MALLEAVLVGRVEVGLDFLHQVQQHALAGRTAQGQRYFVTGLLEQIGGLALLAAPVPVIGWIISTGSKVWVSKQKPISIPENFPKKK